MESLEAATKRIEELEKIVETQNALILALVEQNRALQGHGRDFADLVEYLKSLSLCKDAVPGESHAQSTDAKNDGAREQGECAAHEEVVRENTEAGLIKEACEQIARLVDRVPTHPTRFRMNFTFKEFTAFCSSLDTNLRTDLGKIKMTAGVKSYVDLNKRSLIHYFVENVNEMDLCESFCILAVICRAVDLRVKLAIVYNLLAALSNPYLFLYLVYPVLRDEILGDSLLETTTKKILNFQFATDSEILVGTKIREALEIVSRSLKLERAKEDFAKCATDAIEKVGFDAAGIGEQNEDTISVQMICIFLDWEWCFDFLIRKYLWPAYQKTASPKVLYFLGTVASVGLVLVGKHESVMAVFDELARVMAAEDVRAGAVACYFVRRVDAEASHKWMAQHRTQIEDVALCIDTLTQTPAFF